jgi:hypothetical protein
MTQGAIGTWQKGPGDKISPGDVLVEIETDKAQMDFENQDEGYLAKILVQSGEKDVAVGNVLPPQKPRPNFKASSPISHLVVLAMLTWGAADCGDGGR